jgi:hypothetical protein
MNALPTIDMINFLSLLCFPGRSVVVNSGGSLSNKQLLIVLGSHLR